MRTMSKCGVTRHFPKYPNGCKNSRTISWMKEFLNLMTHTRVLSKNPLQAGSKQVQAFPGKTDKANGEESESCGRAWTMWLEECRHC